MDFAMLVGIPFLLLLVVGGVGTVSGALIGGVSTVLLLIVQDEVSFVVFGVSVLVALTRIGPGLAALGASRSPEGMVAGFRIPRFRARGSSGSTAIAGNPLPSVGGANGSETAEPARASSSRGG
jgi:hypothetical protein